MNRDPEERSTGELDQSALGTHLGALRRSSGAATVLLVDGSGMAVADSGDATQLDRPAFGSLACTHAHASASLASLLGGVEFTASIQQGARTTIVLASTAQDWTLASVYDEPDATCGVSALDPAAVSKLEQLIGSRESATRPGGRVDPEWKAAAQHEIDRVFQEGA